MIRVLHVFHNMGNGGIEHFVMELYRHIDREKVQFDFLTSVDEKGYFDDEIEMLGGKIFHAYPLKANPIKNFKDISNIVKMNQYDIVHRHTGSAFGYYDLKAAKHGGAKNLILHSHNPQAGNIYLHQISKLLLKTDCIKFACSKEAGEFLFGKKADVTIIKNSIDCEKFRFNNKIRESMRQELEVEGKLVIGHIGRFEEQKNHIKLLQIFKEIYERRPDSVLLCVGEGKLLEERKKQASQLGIEKAVHFLGVRDDIEKIMQSFDCFLFPSLYEGFSIVQIEVQANGLSCFTSKKVVPENSNITGNVTFIDLEKNPETWADIILQSNFGRDKNAINIVKKEGYDINDNVEYLCEFYERLSKNGRGR